MKIIAPAPVIFLLTVIVGFILHYFVHIYVFASSMLTSILSAILFMAGVLIAGWALQTMSAANVSPNPYTPTARLIVSGPYQYSRNPMYLSITLVYLAIALMVNSLWFFMLLIPMLILVWRGIIQREEIFLETAFGEQYKNYKKRVRCWL